MNRARRGVTLVELILVVAIISILVSAALPSFIRASERARVRDVQATLTAIANAEKVYNLDEGRFGTDLDLYVNGHYLSDPDPAAGTTNVDWDFLIDDVTANTFTATAMRTGGGYNGNTVVVNQGFDGTHYLGNHPLRDA